ncbi:SH2 domain protein [Dictyocaulus viviparus]|uniref:Tyrosine-protein kinase n=1 Tax=Dictyocaulus viviparus TaxID=29172 RepID=A0A0D8XHL4_DICVI|nr:SH2 domain protein [Dictyocaulus viviparus]
MSVELPSRSQKSHYNSKIRTPKGRKRCSGLVNVNTTQNSEKDERSDLREESCIQKFRLKEEHFTKDDEQILKHFDFYHGFLPREDLFLLVKYVGDYLLRVSEIDNDTTKIRRDIILSVSTEQNPDKSGTKDSNSIGEGGKLGKLKNVVIRKRGRKYLIETHRFFDSLHELMEFYKKNSGTLNRFTFMLKNPIKRQSWEYLHTDVKQGELLGKGAFGEVHAGKLQLKSGEIVEVAIKVHKGCSDLSKAKIKEMMKEARLMRNFNHRNIVRIYGVAVDEQPIYILLELVTGGALNSFLKSNAGQVEVRDKIMMCHGAAQGVEYLHDQRCMHRDLAARNCLITNDKVVKISDFGLSRMGTVYTIRASMRLPIKWLAPETITAYTFSLKTDVFSFGVVVFEIFSDGAEPWEGRTNAEVKIAVVNGEFVKLPMCCPEPLRSFFANKVFTKDPACRANMTDVVAAFERAACPHAPSEASRLRRKVLGFVSIPRLSSL